MTVLHELNDLIAANPEQLLRLLASESRAANLKLLRSRYACLPGLVQVIHTWGQRLNYHFHVHSVLTAGGLSFNDAGKIDPGETRWVDVDLDDAEGRCSELAADFKKRFLKGLRRLWKRGELRLPTSLLDEAALERVLGIVEARTGSPTSKAPRRSTAVAARINTCSVTWPSTSPAWRSVTVA